MTTAPRDNTPPITPQYSPDTAGFEPPHNDEAEQALLGAMMMGASIDDVVDLVHGEDFYHPRHEAIFESILSVATSGQTPEPLLVADEMNRAGTMRLLPQGPVYLHDLLAAATLAANASHYAEIVRDLAARRRIGTAGIKLVQLGHQSHGDVEQVADEAQQAVFAATQLRRRAAVPSAGSMLEEVYGWLESSPSPGLQTGFVEMDKLLGGMRPGQMIILAARPSMGKSMMALDIARHVAHRQSTPALFVSLEMGRRELMLRLLAAESSVSLKALKSQTVSDQDWQRIQRASPKIQESRLLFEDRALQSPMELRSLVRQLVKQQGLGFLVIDYLQLMSSGRRVESRQVEVAEFSRQIKLLAKELEIPILALSQLNRQTETRATRKPELSDLRESGSLEQDADVVIMLHRPEFYDPNDAPGEAIAHVIKNRDGETGVVRLAFQGHFSRFANLSSMP